MADEYYRVRVPISTYKGDWIVERTIWATSKYHALARVLTETRGADEDIDLQKEIIVELVKT